MSFAVAKPQVAEQPRTGSGAYFSREQLPPLSDSDRQLLGDALTRCLLPRGDRRIGIEVKCTESPVVTRSMEIAMKDLRLQKLWIVHRGNMRFTMRPGIEALPVAELGALRGALG